MKEDFVPVYLASTVAVAQKLADRLSNRGIETFVDDTESPMYGMSLGPHSKVIHVREPAEASAREIVQDFQQEYDPPTNPEDWAGQETGMEVVRRTRPSDDSPNEPYQPGTESMAGHAEPGTPELAYMQHENGSDQPVYREEVKAIGGDRPLEESPDIESPEVENQKLDDLNVNEQLDIEESRHPAADMPRHKQNKGASGR